MTKWAQPQPVPRVTTAKDGTVTIPAAAAVPVAFTPPVAAPSVQCTQLPFNNSCIHSPSGRVPGFPVASVASARECCGLCSAALGCVAWNFYDSTCNAFRAVSGQVRRMLARRLWRVSALGLRQP